MWDVASLVPGAAEASTRALLAQATAKDDARRSELFYLYDVCKRLS